MKIPDGLTTWPGPAQSYGFFKPCDVPRVLYSFAFDLPNGSVHQNPVRVSHRTVFLSNPEKPKLLSDDPHLSGNFDGVNC